MLKKRVFVGLVVGAAFAAIMRFANGPCLFVFLLAFALASQAEFYALAARGGYRVYNRTGCFLGLVWFLAVYVLTCGDPEASRFTIGNFIKDWESALIFAGCFVVLMRTLFDTKCTNSFMSSAITCLGILYGPLTLSYYMRLAQWDATEQFATTRAGVFLVFYLSAVIKLSDTGAFAVGTAFGKHKMFPRVSPKKSWEGLAGGIAAGMLVGVGLAYAAAKFSWGPDGVFYSTKGAVPALSLGKAAFISAMLVVIGLFGDLIESMYKRCVGIKDSSSIFPGMGGLLDVVDSLVFAPPLFYFYLLWFR